MSEKRIFDSHIHLANLRLAPHIDEISRVFDQIGLNRAIVVGTSPADWTDVCRLTKSDPRLIPAIGLHPWEVNNAPNDWKNKFLRLLESEVSIIGEIGIDQWIEGYNIDKQLEAFSFQFAVAARKNLPTSIHCLKAHEALLHTLKNAELPKRGFKLHAYNGPLDTVDQLLKLGAYFSFNAGQIKRNSVRVEQIIKNIPDNRILVETDAPDFLPNPQHRIYEFGNTEINHPGNIISSYRAIAEIRKIECSSLHEIVRDNFCTYFSDS